MTPQCSTSISAEVDGHLTPGVKARGQNREGLEGPARFRFYSPDGRLFHELEEKGRVAAGHRGPSRLCPAVCRRMCRRRSVLVRNLRCSRPSPWKLAGQGSCSSSDSISPCGHVEGARRECATLASASAVSSRLLLSYREQVRDSDLGWISANLNQARVSMNHRVIFSSPIGQKPTKNYFGGHKTTEQTQVLEIKSESGVYFSCFRSTRGLLSLGPLRPNEVHRARGARPEPPCKPSASG